MDQCGYPELTSLILCSLELQVEILPQCYFVAQENLLSPWLAYPCSVGVCLPKN